VKDPDKSHADLWAQFAAAAMGHGIPAWYSGSELSIAARSASLADDLLVEWRKRFEKESVS
jgi:hypothetical protein